MTSKVIQTFTGNDVTYKVIKDGYKTVTETIHVTDSMPTRNEYNVSPSSVIYNPNLNYTIDTSHVYPPVIKFNENVTTPDDVEITKDEYILAPYGKEYLISDNVEGIDNFTRIGNIQIDKNGVISGFSSTNKILTDQLAFGTSDYEIEIKFRTSGSTNEYQCLFFGVSSNYSFVIAINPNLYLHSNSGTGSSWDATAIDGNTQLQINKDYIAKVIRINGIRKMYLSEDDGQTWSDENEIADTLSYSYPYYLGTNNSNGQVATNCSIDLSKTVVKINNEVVWQPIWNTLYSQYVPTGSLSIKNGIATSFTSDNYVKILDFQPGNNTWEIKTKLYVTSTSTTQCIFGCLENRYYCPYLRIYNNKLTLYLSSNGSSWNIASNVTSSSTISANTWHDIVLKWTGSSYIVLVDNVTYITVSSSTPIIRNSYALCIGKYLSDTTWLSTGTVNLNETYIKTNGNITWKAFDITKINASIVGSLIRHNDNTVEGFTTTNYYQLINMFNPGNNPWEMCFKFKQYALNNEWRALFGSYYGDYTCGAHFYLTNSGGISFELSSTNSSWNITGTGGIHAANVFTANKWYWAKLKFTGTNYNAYISEDGINFTQISTLSSTTAIKANRNQTIGCDQYASGNHYLNGIIDFSECYIKINNEYWWKGVDIAGRYLPGILNKDYEDTGDAVTLKLYDVETNDRTLILNTDRNVNVSNKKFVQYDGEIQIPDHGLSTYDEETYTWLKYRFIALDVDDGDTTIYTEGNI